MKPRKSRLIYFVCSGVLDGRLISHPIQANDSTQAISFFEAEFKTVVEKIHGPFRKRRTDPVEYAKPLRFSGQSQRAIFNGWLVSALHLIEPAGCSLLLFDRKEDGTIASKPSGSHIVRQTDLQLTIPLIAKEKIDQ